MKKHSGTAVPLELAAPVVSVFQTHKDIEVLAPMWGEKANPEHLHFELCIKGITPGLYYGPVIASIDLTKESYIRRQEEEGVTRKQAERNAHSNLLKPENEWRLETTQTLTSERRAKIVHDFAYAQLEKQIVLRDMAREAFGDNPPVLPNDPAELEIDHLKMDRWTAKRLSLRHGGMQNHVRDELHHLLTHRDVIRDGLDLRLIRRDSRGHWWAGLDTVKTGPALYIEERISTDADVDVATFDGRYVRIYGPNIDEIPMPETDETLEEYLSVTDERLAGRKIIGVHKGRPEGDTDILVEVESDLITVSQN